MKDEQQERLSLHLEEELQMPPEECQKIEETRLTKYSY